MEQEKEPEQEPAIIRAIIEYVNTAKFPDNEDTTRYNYIKFYLSTEMDQEIARIIPEIKFISDNYFARYKLNMLFIKRKCHEVIKCLISINQFIWSSYNHETDEYYAIIELLAKTGDKSKLRLELLLCCPRGVHNYMNALQLFSSVYPITEIETYAKALGHKKLISYIKTYITWNNFPNTLRYIWLTVVLVPPGEEIY